MNSIIWKGVPSTTINGLLISELPPITVPAMRIKETTIDGRDGSIIEDLGYAPYDKPVIIGLHGNFDINKVIKYFTGEGEVVFSNEPDKVYTAKIVGQIDYTRLLRYRQATIPFRVQPFKHKLYEAYKPAPTEVVSGTSIVVDVGEDAKIKSFGIYGKTTQAGTPTPDVPVEMVSVDDPVVSVCGKNLFTAYSESTKTENGITFTENGNGSITINGTATGSAQFNLFALYELPHFVRPGVEYVVSGATSVAAIHVFEMKDNWTRIIDTTSETKFVLSDDATGVLIRYVVQANTVVNNLIVYPMLRLASVTDSTYEQSKPAQAITLNHSIRGIPVPSGGNYTDANGQQWVCDEIDLARGVYVQRINIVGFENAVGKRESYGDAYRLAFWPYDNPTYLPGTTQGGMCNALTYTSAVVSGNKIDNAICAYSSGGVFVRCDAYETVSEFVAWAKSIGLKVQYALETPIETPLSAEDVAAFANIHTYQNSTTVSNDASAYMVVEHFKPYEVFNEGLETSKPIMVLKGKGSVVISVNGLEIFEYTFPNGENEVVIDSEKEDAYLGDVLKNRNMNGEFPTLLPGTNIIEWSGYVSSIEILPRSRWL